MNEQQKELLAKAERVAGSANSEIEYLSGRLLELQREPTKNAQQIAQLKGEIGQYRQALAEVEETKRRIMDASREEPDPAREELGELALRLFKDPKKNAKRLQGIWELLRGE